MQACLNEQKLESQNAALIAAIEAVLKADMTGQLNGGGAYMRHVPEAVLELRKAWRSSPLIQERDENKDAALYKDLRLLMGSDMLGTAREVRLAQDDHSFVVEVGRTTYEGGTLPEAIAKAVDDVCSETSN